MAQKYGNALGKTFLLSDPYEPKAERLTKFVPDNRQIELISAAWMDGKNLMPMAPLLVGEPGIGKNRTVYELAKLSGKDLYIFQGHEDVTAEDLAFVVRFSDEDRRQFEYVASSIVTAMVTGNICFVDEIGKIRPRALSLLASVLDERRYIDSTLLGGRIEADSGFRFIAATNSADLIGDSLPEFIESRLRPRVKINIPDRQQIEEIIKGHFDRFGTGFQELFDTFYSKWAALQEERSDVPPLRPRDAIHLFNLASSYADFEGARKVGSKIEFSGGETNRVTADHIRKAFDDLYGHGYLWEQEGA